MDLDSLLKEALTLKFYSGQLINEQTGATLFASHPRQRDL